jgi:hypothetical protein
MDSIKRNKQESTQFIQELKIKGREGTVRVDGRDRERVDYELKRQEGRHKKSFVL